MNLPLTKEERLELLHALLQNYMYEEAGGRILDTPDLEKCLKAATERAKELNAWNKKWLQHHHPELFDDQGNFK